MKTKWVLFAVNLLAAVSLGQSPVHAGNVFYVAPPPLGSDVNPGTEAQPFATIQRGIDLAASGDTVVVARGTYQENIRFQGKDLVVRSTDPVDTNVVANTIIDGNSAGPVVTFAGTETINCVLAGFSIQDGNANYAAAGYGGGICGGTTDLHTRATIRNNLITYNWAIYGGALAFCNGEVINNRILMNGAYPDGGGLYDCDGTIRNNTIADNWGPEDGAGGGLYGCDGLIEHNLIQGNRMYDGGGLAYCQGVIRHNRILGNIGEYGAGALYSCNGLIQNNVIAFNGGWEAGGLERCNGTIQNNTIATNFGLGLLTCEADIRNCIVWGNSAPAGLQIKESSQPAYCCIENWSAGGAGNFDSYPYFLDLAKTNLHLQSWSPCLDAGDPAFPFANEPMPNGSRIDLGAYGNTAETVSRCADTDADGLPDGWELYWFNDLAQDGPGDPDGDFFPNSIEYRYGRDPTAASGKAARNLTKRIGYFTIKAALAGADHDDEIVVHPGRYEENIRFEGRNIILRSLAPNDASVVSGTIIAASTRAPVISFAGTEGTNCVLAGFTICDGLATNGAGILGGTLEQQTRAAILNNIITNNSASDSGGGLAFCAGLIRSNRFTGNYAIRSGGAVFGCAGTVSENLIDHNVAQTGGGIGGCDGLIQNNIITNNFAYEGNGGGVATCPGLIRGNTIAHNSALEGGGLFGCHGVVEQNVIAANSADQDGGGLAECGATLVNNTVAANSARRTGGGMFKSTGAIKNCILWENTAWEAPALYGSAVPTYSCIQEWTGGGAGNHPYAPYFIDAINGDYHLQSWSPCIDAGDPASLFDHEPQPDGGRIDQGAYGNTSEATPKSLDKDQDRLPDAWEMFWFNNLETTAASDPDGDFLNNETEYLLGRNPLSSTENHVRNVTKATGYPTIQSALMAAAPCDELEVHPGVYPENLRFDGKNVVLRSSAPSDTNVVAQTIIDGRERGAVITFAGTENTNCVVAGFTIRNGHSDWGAGICGGSVSNRTRATLRGNIITACEAPDGAGGGVAFCDGLIEGNLVSTNTGSAFYDCDGTIRSNTIAGQKRIWRDEGAGIGLVGCDGLIAGNAIIGNIGSGLSQCHAAIVGNVILGNRYGGARGCDGLIQNNLITGNRGYDGGGLFECNGTIQNNLISSNSVSGGGGGLSRCRATIQNNTIVNNSGSEGGGLYQCDVIIRNCIIWGNMATNGPQMSRCASPAFSCIENWVGSGQGNLTNSPLFVDVAANNYRLQAASPCVDRGQNDYWFAWPQQDLDGNCRLVGLQIDIGCYEFGAATDTDGDLCSDAQEIAVGTRPDSDDTDGDGLQDGLELLRGSNPRQTTAPGVFHIPSDIPSIQTALCLAVKGDEMVVAPGTYPGSLQFCGTDVTLHSADPANPTATILDGQSGGPVVSFAGRETEACSLSGFTVQNGAAYYGGGVFGNGTRAALQHNLITHNSAWYGGGVYGCNGLIRDSIFTGNVAQDNGGGLSGCHGTIRNNNISGNRAIESGGGVAECHGVIENNRIQGNWGEEGGGGLYACNGVIRNNWIEGNQVDEGPGGGLALCEAVIQNNLILRNSASYGGGLALCQGTIQNNTIFGNGIEALAFCTNPIVNCILWANWVGINGELLYMSATPSYSCIQGWTGGGTGNTASDPRFVNPAGNDFRLLVSSPCIDAGNNFTPNLASTDFLGRPRILHGGHGLVVDLGPYEFWSTTCAIGPGSDEITLTWGSLSGKTYTISCSEDLFNWRAVAQVPSAGNLTTSWLDDGSHTGIPPGSAPRRFYRWAEN